MIERGHSFDDLVNKYTMDQVQLFYTSAQEIRRIGVVDHAMATRIAFHADGKGWMAYLKSMGVEAARKVTSRDDLRKLRNIGRRRK